MILLVQELKCAISNIEDFTKDITRGGQKKICIPDVRVQGVARLLQVHVEMKISKTSFVRVTPNRETVLFDLRQHNLKQPRCKNR